MTSIVTTDTTTQLDPCTFWLQHQHIPGALDCSYFTKPTVVRVKFNGYNTDATETFTKICIEELGSTLPSGKGGSLPDCAEHDAASEQNFATLFNGYDAPLSTGEQAVSLPPALYRNSDGGSFYNHFNNGSYSHATASSSTVYLRRDNETYTVVDTIAPIPLPATGLLLLAALLFTNFVKKRQHC